MDYPRHAPPGRPGEGHSLSTSADRAASRGLAEKLGIEPGMAVQVVGSDSPGAAVDQALLDDVALRAGTELITTDDSDEVVDVVLLWWREGDGDLVDALVDSLTDLVGGGAIWLLTPKVGRPGAVDPADVAESAPIAGLSTTTTVAVGREWTGTRLVAPKSR